MREREAEMGTKKRKKLNVGNIISTVIAAVGSLAWIFAIVSIWLFRDTVDDVWPFGLHVGWYVFGGAFLMLLGASTITDD